MQTLELRDLDRDDAAMVRTFWEVNHAAVADRPYNTYLAWQAASTYLPVTRPDMLESHLTAWAGGRMVGTCSVTAPLLENTHVAWVSVFVAPDARRRGVGSALLAEAEARARAWDRRVLDGEAFADVGSDDSSSMAFARARGFQVVLEDGMKVVDLVATRDGLEALAASVADAHQEYRLVTTWGPVPDDLVEGYCRINSSFNGEAPSNDAELQDEVWDVARVRTREDRTAPAGRHDLYTFALGADGEVVAFTELFINETAQHRAFQGGTLVLRAHRGHRLGLAVKVANHAALVERWPAVEWMVTTNADVNAPMSAINDRLGYRVVERCFEVKKRLSA